MVWATEPCKCKGPTVFVVYHLLLLLLLLLHCEGGAKLRQMELSSGGGIKQGGRPGSAVWFGQPCKCKGPTIFVVYHLLLLLLLLLHCGLKMVGAEEREWVWGGRGGKRQQEQNAPRAKKWAGLRPRAVPGGFV